MDVLTTAYRAAQPTTAPPPGPSDDSPTDATCARCGQPTHDRIRTTNVISKLFTAFDSWADPTSRYLCPVCSWGYRHPPLREGPHHVTKGTLTALNRPGVVDVLSSGRLPNEHALVVPLRPGRKHLLPEATWGQVTTDHAQLTWTADDALRLTVLARLRGRGFGSRLLTQQAPAYHVLARLPRRQHAAVLDDWDALQPWRTRTPWLDLAIYATTPTQEATT